MLLTAIGGLVGWVLFAALTGVIGILGSRLWLPSVAAASSPDIEDAWTAHDTALWRTATWLAVSLFFGMVAVLARQLAEFRDPFAPLAEDAALLMSTEWGTAWSWATLGAFLVLVGVLLQPKATRLGWGLASVGALGVAGYPGRTGHANAIDSLRWLSLAADWVHIVAAGVWVGGVGVVGLLYLRSVRAGPSAVQRLRAAPMIERFSRTAQLCVALILATGLYASWQHVPAWSALWVTTYGRLLVGKVVLVSLALGIGWWNWKHVTPRLGRDSEGDSAARDLAQSARREFWVAQAVLLVTAFLVRISPGDGMP